MYYGFTLGSAYSTERDSTRQWGLCQRHRKKPLLYYTNEGETTQKGGDATSNCKDLQERQWNVHGEPKMPHHTP